MEEIIIKIMIVIGGIIVLKCIADSESKEEEEEARKEKERLGDLVKRIVNGRNK